MFAGARLRLTLLYAGLLGFTLLLAVGVVAALAAQDTRRTDDLELRLRAESLASRTQQGALPSASAESHDDDHDEREHHLEGQGILTYALPVAGGRVSATPQSPAGLPDAGAAQRVLSSGSGHYATAKVSGGRVRLYSLPVLQDGQATAVIQVARTEYFVNTAVGRIVLYALAAGGGALLLSSLAAYWLAGRTLRPIADSLERQRTFTAHASHELRTPLTVVYGNAEILAQHPDRRIGEYADVVQDILQESGRLNRMVTDLLTLARADEGQVPLRWVPVDLSTVAAAIVQQFTPLAEAKGLELCADLQPDVTVEGDPDRFRELLTILVDNAVRYTTGRIAVHVAREPGGACQAVSDTGPGIAPEHLPHIFERFYRADRSGSSESGGTGLGLAIARWIAASHGGRIDVQSSPGHGTTFTAHLPTEPPRPNG